MKKTKITLEKAGKTRSNNWLLIVLVLVVGAVIGFFIGKDQAVAPENCVPQEDLDFFTNEANKAMNDYQTCVKEAWDLQLLCKMQIDAWKSAASACNATI